MNGEPSVPQVGEVLGLVRDVLGDDLIGAYLHGSAVLGGPLPTSDLDVLVVSRRATTTDERRRLVEHLLALSVPPSDARHGRPDARPIELTIVVLSAVRPWRFPPEMDFQYGDWLRDELQAGTIPVQTHNADLAVLIHIARLGNVALAGPPPVDLFEPIPRRDLMASMRAGLDELVADLDRDSRNVVLTLARIWMTLATGDIRRKDDAAAWAAERLSSHGAQVLRRARTLYLRGEYGPWGELGDSVPTAAQELLSEIRRLAAG